MKTILLAACLCGTLIAGASVPAIVVADAPASTATDPAYPISEKTGAPSGDAHFGVDPLVPYGTEPQVPVTSGYVNLDHDHGVTTNGQVDLPF